MSLIWGFKLRYLLKLGKIKEVRIVGLPVEKRMRVGEVVRVLSQLTKERN